MNNMILNYKAHRSLSHICLSLQAGGARSVDPSCTRAKALQYARVKQGLLLAAISALAVVSASSTVAFAATSAPAASISTTSLSFGYVTVDTNSAPHTLTLTNTGNAALSVTSMAITGANASNFAQSNNCGSSVTAGASCTISMTFKPTAAATYDGTLSISDNAANGSLTVSLIGVGIVPVLGLSPTKLSFGSLSVGTSSAAQTISVQDFGRGTLEITGLAITGANASDFLESNNCGSSVASQGSCTISVTFKPTASGRRSASVNITDNATGSPQTIALYGTATAPVDGLSPTSLSFGNQSVGTTSAPQTATLSNTGNAALDVSSLAITGTNAGDFVESNTCGSSVAGGASCTISVTFKPTASGSRTASLTITDNASGSPQSIALSGTGTTPTPAATPTFSVASGTYTSTQTVAISDTTAGATIYYTTNGATPTTSSSQYSTAITISSTETIQAIATASGYSTSPVATATYTITPPAATPSFSVASGTYTSTQTVAISDTTAGATIYYTTNGATPTTSSSQYSTAITVSSTETIQAIATASGYSTSPVATATYTISLSIVSLSPTTYVFPSQGIDTTSAAQTFTLSNTGSVPLSITSLAITGANAGDFVEVADTCGSSVAAGGNCTIGVTFTPSLAGSETASVTIADNAGGSPQTASLSGAGLHDVTLSWSASGSTGIAGYYVYRGTTSGGESATPLNSTPINGTTFTDTNVTGGTTYYYVVTAVGSDGVQSGPSSETKATAL